MDEHSLQSPFTFNLFQKALNPLCRKFIHSSDIEECRLRLQKNSRSIRENFFGSGSSLPRRSSKNINSIAKQGISDREQSEILANLIEYFEFKNVLELGTSLGLNSAYLSRSAGIVDVVTVEGNIELAQEAENVFASLNLKNIKLETADIDRFFKNCSDKFDMIYLDANHTFDATLSYFDSSRRILSKGGIIVIDDINWSPDMNKAWKEILVQNPDCLTIENDKIGIVFLDKNLISDPLILKF